MKNSSIDTGRRVKLLWAVWGNGYGFRGPLPVYWIGDLKSWWAKNLNDQVKKPGLDWRGGIFSFASANRDEVVAFARGYAACAKIVRGATEGCKENGGLPR
jgi:hypothetical protein